MRPIIWLIMIVIIVVIVRTLLSRTGTGPHGTPPADSDAEREPGIVDPDTPTTDPDLTNRNGPQPP